METTTVIKPKSSLLKELTYDKDKKVLTVIFKSSKVRYRYYNLSLRKFIALRDSESKGSYFVRQIKGKYKTRKLKKN